MHKAGVVLKVKAALPRGSVTVLADTCNSAAWRRANRGGSHQSRARHLSTTCLHNPSDAGTTRSPLSALSVEGSRKWEHRAEAVLLLLNQCMLHPPSTAPAALPGCQHPQPGQQMRKTRPCPESPRIGAQPSRASDEPATQRPTQTEGSGSKKRGTAPSHVDKTAPIRDGMCTRAVTGLIPKM